MNVGLEYLSANSIAILKGLLVGDSLGILPCCIDSDVSRLVVMLNNKGYKNFVESNVIGNINWLMMNSGIPFISLPKNGSNSDASSLARQAIGRGSDLAWKEGIPCNIPSVLIDVS